MSYFIIGDIHGCYYALEEMLAHWNPAKEKLILLGDLVHKGKHSYAVLEKVIQLQKKYPEKVIVLKGNNDEIFQQRYEENITLSDKQKFETYNLNYLSVLQWLEELPHFYEDAKIFASHAGFPARADEENGEIDFLFHKGELKKLKKTQFLGHVVVEEPKFVKDKKAWYLDTGAGWGKSLTGIKLSKKAKVNQVISISVTKKDVCMH
ncbi:metallophosphoesterase [Ornithobacterium rhinotracheale]|uniref:metallophosphoesterase n=1 Tax=Ornithobacterium rhinotracheale TaxID=28251 RepID=UPI003FA409B4